METEIDVDLAPELMADVRMARHRHAVTRIVRHVETRIAGVARKVVAQMDHRSEAILLVARLATGTPAVIADRADLHTWVTVADLQKDVTLNVDRVAATQKVVPQKAATSREEEKDHRLAVAKAAGALGLQCEAVDRRFRVVDRGQADHRGLSVVSHRAADLRSVVADRDDLKWDHHGPEAEVRKVAGHRSVAVDRDVRRWDLRG